MAPALKPNLRCGWTTGACATAAALAAASALRAGCFPDPITIRLPGGQTPSFALAHRWVDHQCAEAGVIKDAGDDPDVTHGALIIARVRLLPRGMGLVFKAGEGIGYVTRLGLPLPPGEPAINAGPQAMIAGNLAAIGVADAEVVISIPGGELLARQTLNGRLGIVGGLSILGTTGIVVPYSCSAWVHTIHRAIDVARAAGLDHLAAVTGKTSELGLVTLHPGLTELAVIDTGDFVGGFLKYLRRQPVARITIAGGFAKLTKLAVGHLNLHSSSSEIDFGWLAGVVATLGGAPELEADARSAVTAFAVLELAQAAGIPLADAIAARAMKVADAAVSGRMAIEVAVFDRNSRLVGHAQ
ncbi:MAG: cobalt-precorrin-5B (C(1))-methyltransferase [Rhodospirillaceae bacterium]